MSLETIDILEFEFCNKMSGRVYKVEDKGVLVFCLNSVTSSQFSYATLLW